VSGFQPQEASLPISGGDPPPTLVGSPWEWTYGFFPTERAATDTYNRLYPEGGRAGVVGSIEWVADEQGEVRYRLDLSRWPEQSRRRD
jgi:hypothetical protein